MTLDGNNNTNEYLPLLTPYSHHPGAPSTGRSLSYSLKQAYLYTRTQTRLIGIQTYKQWPHGTITSSSARTINATTWVGTGEWRVEMPPHATHIVCLPWYRLYGGEGQLSQVHHRVVITDGTNTDTGNDFSEERDVTPPVVGFDNIRWNENDAEWFPAECNVFRVDTRSSSFITCTVTCQAYAIETDGGASIRYRPGPIVAYWVVYD